MKCVILHYQKVDGSILASARIAKMLQDKLNCPILDFVDCKYIDNYDVVFLVSCPSIYAKGDMRWHFACIMLKSKICVYVQNDYTLRAKDLSCMQRLVDTFNINYPDIHALTTIPKNIKTQLSSYINWNALSYAPTENNDNKISGLLYYGAFRDGRVDYFKKYLNTALYPVYVSSSIAGIKKFKNIASCIIDVGVFGNLIYDISKYSATIYIEDKYGYKNYCSPASRFYECLSAGVAQYFDKSTAENMLKAGIDVSKYVVDSAVELNEKIKNYKNDAKEQVEIFSKDYKKILSNEVDSALDKIKSAL